jgi:hypothetical protein
MDQTCPVVHKSCHPQARLKTVTLFYIHCGLGTAMQVLKVLKVLKILKKNHFAFAGGLCVRV